MAFDSKTEKKRRSKRKLHRIILERGCAHDSRTQLLTISLQEANLVLLEYFPSYQEDQKGRIDQLKGVYAEAKEDLMQHIRENKTTQFDTMAEEYRQTNDTIVEGFLSEGRWSKWHADLNVPLTKTRDEFLKLDAQGRREYLQQTLNSRFSRLRKLRT